MKDVCKTAIEVAVVFAGGVNPTGPVVAGVLNYCRDRG